MENIELQVSKALSFAGVGSVVLGYSGGADSTALLLCLATSGIRTVALHCNFHLRGAESMRDEEFVRQTCDNLGIKLIVKDFDTESYRASHKLTVETACRELRYGEFRRLREEAGYDRIAVAHNSDDQAETVLLNLMRGSGVAGLRGMQDDTGEIIRPFLNISRREIIAYLTKKGQDYVTDSTNLESHYRRNFLRNEVIPLLETRWPHARESICATASIMAAEEKILCEVEENLTDPASARLHYSAIRKSGDPFWLIRRYASRHGANTSQCREITESVTSERFISGKIWYTPKGRIYAGRDYLEFLPGRNSDTGSATNPNAEFESKIFTPESMPFERVKASSNNELWTTLSPEEIKFRQAKPGDRILPLGMKGSTLVSKVLKDAKLTQAEKEKIMVATDKSSEVIVWIEGLKRSGDHLVAKDSLRFYRYRRIR